MPDFDKVEDTLFVPMLGRIYASENFPQILKDDKALEIKHKLPDKIKGQDTQDQYTLLASAVRSSNLDRYIDDFLSRHPDGAIVELGCGLETGFYRSEKKGTTWFEIDLPDVIEYRREILGEPEGEVYIAADAFAGEWIEKVREVEPDAPLLVTASGVYYYFPEEKVLGLHRMLAGHGYIESVFDTVNSKGMKRMAHYMEKVGHADAEMYFCVDDPNEMASEAGCTLLKEEPYYSHTEKKGMKFMTSTSMKVSDRYMMVKMIHLRVN